MTTGRLTGKVAIITGGAKGMGASHASGFVAQGARVAIADIDEEAGTELAASLGENAIFVKLDVTDPVSWAAAVTATEKAFGPISVLVNNAGIGEITGSIADYEPSRWRRVLEVNLFGSFNGIQAVVPSMKRGGGGSIINVASAHGRVGGPKGASAYTSSKFAIVGMSKTAAFDLAPDNIRVNTLCPGVVMTPMASAALSMSDNITKDFPIQRFGSPEEITPMAVFLASDESSFCSGADYFIDGGMQAGFKHV